jgi:DNA-binding transcriptional LysR family regulator
VGWRAAVGDVRNLLSGSLPDPPPDLTILEIARGEVLIACHRGYRLAGRASVALDDLATECFVASPPGSRGRDYIDRIFTKAGDQLAPAVHAFLDLIHAAVSSRPIDETREMVPHASTTRSGRRRR